MFQRERGAAGSVIDLEPHRLLAAQFGQQRHGLRHQGVDGVPDFLATRLYAVAQLVVQLRYFLHLGSSADQRSNTGIFICTALLIAIIVAGSLWVIHNANVNMMPTQISVERALARD